MQTTQAQRTRSDLLDQVYDHMLMHLEVGLHVLHEVDAPGADLDVAYRNLKASNIWMLRALALNTDVEYYVDQLLEPAQNGAIAANAWPDDIGYLIDHFGIKYPERKQEYWPYLQLLNLVERAGITPIDLMRMGALSIDMVKLLMNDDQLYPKTYIVTEADENFMGHYTEKRVMRVDAILAHADKVDPLPGHQMAEHMDSWPVTCPRCEQQADMLGYQTKQGAYACSMLCQHCGAYLFDMKELQLAGLALYFP